MNRSLVATTLLVLAVSATALGLPACSSDSSSAPPPQGTVGDDGGTSSGDPAQTPPDGTTPTPTPTPTPEPEWMPPVVATTSPACGTARADAVQADFTTPGGRTFHVWGPSGYDPNKTYPVVMVFHGIQSDGVAHESWFKMEDYTNNEAFVVYPDAGGNGYWDVSGDKDLVFFDEMVKQLGATYCINPSRVLGYGFSYGGYFADHLGCKRAGYVKAIAVGEGGTAGHAKCGRLPVLVTTRTHDTNEPPSHGLNVETAWTTGNSCGAAGAKLPQTDPNGGEAMGYCRVHASCKSPGSLTYCEDTSFDAGWPTDWNHTVREYYRSYTYKWFKALP